MKFTLSWLKDWLETSASAEEIADTLTRIGLEVEGISNPAEALAPFRVARVLTAEKHPQADKLQVLTVDAGDGPLQVVCGAPNARAGMLGVFGPPGAYVPGSAMTLKVAAIRGVESNGMMCSVRELELGDEHDGIIELAADAPVGASFAEYAGLNDPLFDVNVTPNRPDCLGVEGIARDLAAAGLGTFKARTVAPLEGRFDSTTRIHIEEGSGCKAFVGVQIRGVRNGPSPEWLQKRLKAVGLRPISTLVDVTNFFSVDRARPLHVYDVNKLKGGIVARRGKTGERFVALNDKEYEATLEDTVIADGSGIIGFGGVMGGESTGVDETTTDVLLECAWFEPGMVAATGRRHGIISDARARFERGVDPGAVEPLASAAARMIVDLCGGEASSVRVVESADWQQVAAQRTVSFRSERVRALAGVDVSADEQAAILNRLGFKVDGDSVAVPTWRPDVDGEADIVEEVARIRGFDAVPSTPLDCAPGVAKPTATRAQMVERRARRAAAARGLDEAVTWSFVSEGEAQAFGGGSWRVANPISEELKVMRPSLLAGLVSAARRNIDRGAASVRLFEIGRRYLDDAERLTLGLLLAGERQSRGWHSGKARPFDAFDAKAEVLAILDAAGAPAANLQLFPDAGPNWHPGRSARLGLGPKMILAAFGELHPALQKSVDAPAGAVAAEIFLDAIPAPRASGRARAAYDPPALQAITRDFAFIVPADLTADALQRAIRGSDKGAITNVRLFDRFESSEGLSLAFEVTLQPTEKSFTDEQIAEISRRIIAAAEKLGASLRG